MTAFSPNKRFHKIVKTPRQRQKLAEVCAACGNKRKTIYKLEEWRSKGLVIEAYNYCKACREDIAKFFWSFHRKHHRNSKDVSFVGRGYQTMPILESNRTLS